MTGVTIAQVDDHFRFIPGTEKHFDVDTICVAVGLSPMAQLLKMDGVEMADTRGGYIPKCDETGATSIPGIYAAGDVAGIEEASSAMIEGRMSGAAIAEYLGYMTGEEKSSREEELDHSLEALRQGMFAPKNRGKKIEKTEEGIDISETLLTKGYIADDEIKRFPGYRCEAKVHPVIECTQNIPCNPCQTACRKGCISIGDNITSLPISVKGSECIDCGMCVASCSGQAIFLVKKNEDEGTSEITIPYEFLPLPEVGDKGSALSRSGQRICEAEITRVRTSKAYDGTNLVTMKVPTAFEDSARFFIKA